jgi:hypothetical protein
VLIRVDGSSCLWQVGVSVEVLVQRTTTPITRAAVRPASAAARVLAIGADGVRLAVSANARFHLDVDGGLDTTDTGPDYAGPPMHTFEVFGEPLEPTPPQPGAAGVYYVHAGDVIPSATALPPNTTTLAFGPGVHRVQRNADGYQLYTLPNAVKVHLALGSVVHAAFQSEPSARWATQQISVGGYGVLSGEENLREAHTDARHTARATPHAGCSENLTPQGITISGAARAHLTGITLVDHPNHHIIAGVAGECEGGQPNGVASNLKILGWRANGDGLHVFSSWRVSDLFMRTQDDSMCVYTRPPPLPPKPTRPCRPHLAGTPT